jgi:hypothetical protein
VQAVVAPQAAPEPAPVLEPATVESVMKGLNLDGFTYNEDEGAFIYFIPVEYNKAGSQISTDSITGYLKKLKWIDRQTRAVTLRFPVYNGNYMLFAIIEVRFEFELGGLMNKHLNINVMDLEATPCSATTSFHAWSTKSSSYWGSYSRFLARFKTSSKLRS